MPSHNTPTYRLSNTVSTATILGAILAGCSSGSDENAGDLYAGYGTGQLSQIVLTPATIAPQGSVSSVASFQVTPALPTGLSLNPTTGVISGTPSAARARQTYTVRAVNGDVYDDETISLEVRGPILGLSSNVPLVRTTISAAAAPTTDISSLLTSATTAPVTSSSLPSIVDAPETTIVGSFPLATSTTLSTATPAALHDSTQDFVAAISVDDSELTVDPWTLAVGAPYDTANLTPDVAGFNIDTSAATLVDGEFTLETSLATPALGPFVSSALPTVSGTIARLADSFDDMFLPTFTVGASTYFMAEANGTSNLKLYRSTPGTTNTVEQVIDLNPGISDEVHIVMAVGTDLILILSDGFNWKLFLYDTVGHQLHQMTETNATGDDVSSTLGPRGGNIAAIGDEVFFVATDGTDDRIYRYTPALGGTAASTDRVSATRTNIVDPQDVESLVALDGKLYFSALYGDGMTSQVFELDPATSTQSRLTTLTTNGPIRLAAAAGAVYAIAEVATGVSKLHRLDPMTGAFEQVVNTTGNQATDDRLFFESATSNALIFQADDAAGGERIYLYEHDDTAPALTLLGPNGSLGSNDVVPEVFDTGDFLLMSAGDATGALKLFGYEYATGDLRQLTDGNGPGIDDDPFGFHLLPDGRVTMTMSFNATGGGSACVWDPETGITTVVGDPSGPAVDDFIDMAGHDASGRMLFLSELPSNECVIYVVE